MFLLLIIIVSISGCTVNDNSTNELIDAELAIIEMINNPSTQVRTVSFKQGILNSTEILTHADYSYPLKKLTYACQNFVACQNLEFHNKDVDMVEGTATGPSFEQWAEERLNEQIDYVIVKSDFNANIQVNVTVTSLSSISFVTIIS